MKKDTKQLIISTVTTQFALHGFEGVSMRELAKQVGIAPSVLYHHFETKEDLLKEMYLQANRELGTARALLDTKKTFSQMLDQRIKFQFEHAEQIVAVLKYYMHYRLQFEANERGFLPVKTYLHIEEILELAQKNHEYSFPNIEREAKVITHAINGFILEYFPDQPKPKQLNEITQLISEFVLRAVHPYKSIGNKEFIF